MCIWTETFDVELIPPLQFEAEVTDADCPDSNNAMISIENVSGGIPPYTYSVDGNTFQSGTNFDDLVPGNYNISLLDSDNCLLAQNMDVGVGNEISVDLPMIQTINLGESILLNPNINISLIDSYQWIANGIDYDAQDISIEVSPTENTIYTLTIFYGDCMTFAESLVEIIVPSTENVTVYLGDTFSPFSLNNSVFFVQSKSDAEASINSFSIYDRWGELLFVRENVLISDSSLSWNGRFNGELVMPGVYVYYIKLGEPFNEIKVGDFTVIH